MIIIRQIVNEIFTSNTYVISQENSKDYWLVDIGDYSKVIDLLPTDAVIRGVFLTHTHFDHIYGINLLLKEYPNCVIYTSRYGYEALQSAKKNFSLYHQNPIEYKGDNIVILKEADTISLYKDVNIKVYESYGHCPSCLTYIVKQYLFTGDAYIPNIPVVSKLPKGNKELAEKSKNKILYLSKGKIICAGHGPIYEHFN